MRKIAGIAVAGMLASSMAWAGDAPIAVKTRETALAATVDIEFQDAMTKGVSGAAILEQDGAVSLRAGYGFSDASKTTPFTVDARVPTGIMATSSEGADWVSSAEDVYRWYLSPRFSRDGTSLTPSWWDFRKAEDGHVVQISRKMQNGAFLSYFCWRPDDKVFVYFIATGGEAADAMLLNRVMTSVRDAGKMPVTDLH